MEKLDFQPGQRPGVESKPGDKGLELDEKRTKECWQQMKQQLRGLHLRESHLIGGYPSKSVNKERL